MLALVSSRMTTSSGSSPGAKNFTCLRDAVFEDRELIGAEARDRAGAAHRSTVTLRLDEFRGAAEGRPLRHRACLPHRQECCRRPPRACSIPCTAPSCSTAAGLRRASKFRTNHKRVNRRTPALAAGLPNAQVRNCPQSARVSALNHRRSFRDMNQPPSSSITVRTPSEDVQLGELAKAWLRQTPLVL